MTPSFTYQTIPFSNREKIDICLPNAAKVKYEYEVKQASEGSTPFPFWAKLWDSAIVLSDYLLKTNCCYQKRVIEFGCGLGLPSIVAARTANIVIATDKEAACEGYIQKSAEINHLKNLRFQVLDWTKRSYEIDTDLVLLSDINYEPAIFEKSIELIRYFHDSGIQLVLTTPHRLTAREFVTKLEPYVKEHIIFQKEELGLTEPISLLNIT